MFDIGFPRDWSSLKKLIWLKAAISGGGASAVWKTVTGSLIHITDALASPMQKCEVSLEPIQDLNGQDAPYPAGGGKNKLQNLQTTQTISGVTFTVYDDGSVNVNGTASDLVVFSLNDTLQNYLTNGQSYILSGSPINSDTSKWKLRVYNSGIDSIDAGSGVTFTFFSTAEAKKCDIVIYSGTTMSNVLFKPMIRLSSVADATFAPYSNICPITGWTGANVTRAAFNLFDKSAAENGKYINDHGVLISNAVFIASDYIRVSPNTTYYCNHIIGDGSLVYNFFEYDANKTLIRMKSTGSGGGVGIGGKATTITTGSDTYYVRFNGSESVIDVTNFNISCSDNGTYKPYAGTTLSVTFPDGLINQWDGEWEVGDYTEDGEPHSFSSRIRTKNPIPCLPSTSYYYVTTGILAQFFYYDINDDFISTTSWRGAGEITTPDNCRFIRFYLVGTDPNVGINYPSTIRDYHPYHDDVVYGGTVDLVSGVLTVDKAKTTVGNLSWDYYNTAVYTTIQGKKAEGVTQKSNIICDLYKAAESVDSLGSANTWENNTIRGSITRNPVYIKDTRYTSASAFKAACSDVEIVYELATPITYQLTPQEISTLKGENNVWSNSNGDTTLIYKAQAE